MNPIFKNPLVKLLTINDLATKSFQSKMIPKKSIPILIIDDNEFVYEDEMKNIGYDIRCIQDLEDTKMAVDYQIIISDIKGVGKKISNNEGVGLIYELKKLYPYKQYGVYTGNKISIELTTFLDGIEIIPKRFDKDDWNSLLYDLIKRFVDPKTLWIKLRDILLEEGVSMFDLTIFEHRYVDAVINKNSNFENLFDKKYKIPDDLKTILLNMTSTAITSSIGM